MLDKDEDTTSPSHHQAISLMSRTHARHARISLRWIIDSSVNSAHLSFKQHPISLYSEQFQELVSIIPVGLGGCRMSGNLRKGYMLTEQGIQRQEQEQQQGEGPLSLYSRACETSYAIPYHSSKVQTKVAGGTTNLALPKACPLKEET